MKRIALLESSSTKLAIFFSCILATALALLSWEIYALMQGKPVSPLLSISILVLLTLIAIGLFIISFYVTKRINTIAATADAIMTTRDLSQRIPIDSRWDDLSKLATTLNLMLDDIEQLVASVRQVSDNVAHDLRTPLTRLRNHIESLRASTGDVKPEELSSLIGECDGLLSTFNALLRIAHIETGRHSVTFTPVNLGDVLRDVVELYEPVASEKSIQFSYRAEPVQVMGDKDMLFQAIANLIDNAIKYTPEGGIVVATVTATEHRVTLTLTDSGIGIADMHKPNVFRRFFRVDTARCTHTGNGLGLSLVAAIVQLHNGSITLSDHHPSGLVVTVTL